MKSFIFYFFLLFIVVQNVLAKPFDDDRIIFPDQLGTSSEIIKNESSESDESLEEQGNIDLESGNYYQGDIQLSPEQEILLKSKDNLTARTGLLFEDQRWEKNGDGHVIMPYTIEKSYSESQTHFLSLLITTNFQRINRKNSFNAL